MKTAFLFPLLILFGGWGTSYSDHVSSYRPYQYARQETTITATSSRTTSVRSPARVQTPVKTVKPVVKPAVQPPAPVVTTPPPAAPVPAPTPASESVATQIERLIFERMNNERTQNSLGALTADTKLATIARAHSADMIAKKYFSHTDQNGCGSSCRANNAGYAWQAIGENIYMMSGYAIDPEKIAAMVVTGWMNSSGHRANILGSQFTHDGVGVVVEGTSVYVTALYAKPR